jgi:hypothetical protein
MNEQLPQTCDDQGRSLIDRIERLTIAIGALVDINRQLCKKLEQQDVKLTALARFVSSQSSETPIAGVL